MSPEWVATYRTYSDSDLAEEITFLKAQSRNPFSSQQQGNRAYQRNTAETRDRLQAATQVQQERANRSNPAAHGPLEPDFSQIQV